MTFLSEEDAVTAIVEKVELFKSDAAVAHEAAMQAYAERFVLDVIDYCHRSDFPKSLVYTAADLICNWLDDLDNGGRGAMRSIKEDDTEFTFAVSDMSQLGSTVDADFDTIKPKLNLYRKVRWPTA